MVGVDVGGVGVGVPLSDEIFSRRWGTLIGYLGPLQIWTGGAMAPPAAPWASAVWPSTERSASAPRKTQRQTWHSMAHVVDAGGDVGGDVGVDVVTDVITDIVTIVVTTFFSCRRSLHAVLGHDAGSLSKLLTSARGRKPLDTRREFHASNSPGVPVIEPR